MRGETKITEMVHVTAMPIYGENHKYVLLQNQKSDDFETWHGTLMTQTLRLMTLG